MSDYSRSYDFSVKDALATGNPAKKISGAEVDVEFDSLVVAVATKANKVTSPSENALIQQSATGDLVDSGITPTTFIKTLLDDTTADIAKVTLDMITGTTGTLKVPSGTTAQRSASVGIRYNTTVSSWEGYDGSDWGNLAPSLPAGVVVPYAGSTPPTGWLLCDGSAVSQATYAALYAVIGVTYGDPGGGNFNLPDLQGKVPVGIGAGSFSSLNDSAGAETHTLDLSETPAHSHSGSTTSPGGSHSHNVIRHQSGGSGNTPGASNFSNNPLTLTPATSSSTVGSLTVNVASEGGGGAHNNLQPSLGLNYIISTGA